MWIFAHSVYVGKTDETTDFWSVHNTEEEAQAALKKVEDKDIGYWAIGPIRHGSEPQYTEG